MRSIWTVASDLDLIDEDPNTGCGCQSCDEDGCPCCREESSGMTCGSTAEPESEAIDASAFGLVSTPDQGTDDLPF